MNSCTHIYKIPAEINQSSYKSIKSDYQMAIKYSERNKVYRSIMDAYLNDLKDFSLDVLNIKLSTDDIKMTKTDLNPINLTLELLQEQNGYFDQVMYKFARIKKKYESEVADELWDEYGSFPEKMKEEFNKRLDEKLSSIEGCETYFIEAHLNGHLYGGIFAFYHGDYPDRIMIQGIVKYVTPTLFELLFPKHQKELVKLNSILAAPIETLARRLGAKYIYVRPIGKQGSILERFYGYKRTNDEYYPPDCNVAEGFSVDPFYRKLLE